MSPSEEATARLRRLIRDLDADVAAMDARAAELAAAALRPPSAEVTARVTVTLDQSTLHQLDRFVAAGRFTSRGTAIQVAVDEKLRRLGRARLTRECAKLGAAPGAGAA